MHNFGIILTFLFASTSPLEAPKEVEMREAVVIRADKEARMGDETVADIRLAYEQGEYDGFLKEMDADYLAAKDSNEFAQFLEMRKSSPSPSNTDWSQQFETWKKERDEKLLQACQGKKDDLFCKKVASVAAPMSPEEKGALKQLASYRFMLPGAGSTSDENRLISLDAEYEYKMIHADSNSLLNPDLNQQRIQHEVLSMEHMDKLQKLSPQMKDELLKEMIDIAAKNHDKRLAKVRDAFDLQALKQKAPLDATEKLLAAILESYQGKYSQLYHALLDDKESK